MILPIPRQRPPHGPTRDAQRPAVFQMEAPAVRVIKVLLDSADPLRHGADLWGLLRPDHLQIGDFVSHAEPGFQEKELQRPVPLPLLGDPQAKVRESPGLLDLLAHGVEEIHAVHRRQLGPEPADSHRDPRLREPLSHRSKGVEVSGRALSEELGRLGERVPIPDEPLVPPCSFELLDGYGPTPKPVARAKESTQGESPAGPIPPGNPVVGGGAKEETLFDPGARRRIHEGVS